MITNDHILANEQNKYVFISILKQQSDDMTYFISHYKVGQYCQLY